MVHAEKDWLFQQQKHRVLAMASLAVDSLSRRVSAHWGRGGVSLKTTPTERQATPTYLPDEPLAAVYSEESFMHSVRRWHQLRQFGWNGIRVDPDFLIGIGLGLKHGDVRVPYQQGEGAVQGAKFLDLIGAPPPGWSFLQLGRVGF